MTERLAPADTGLLADESLTVPRHTGTLEVFETPRSGFDYDKLVALIADRIAFVPRYRQRLRTVPGRVAAPVWVDDEDFDLTYHVRRSALPRPGSMHQLRELVARIMSRRLDRSRPLWEVYLVEGVGGGRFALLWKSHQVLVDGVATVDLNQVLLDLEPTRPPLGPDEWRPQPEPRSPALLAEAVAESVRNPGLAVSTARGTAGSLLRVAGTAATKATALAGSLTGSSPARDSPVSAVLSQHRRFATVRTDLEQFRKVRRAHGGTVNDVILATLTGAMRAWLLTRAEPVHGSAHVRAMVPMSVIDNDLQPTSLGTAVAGHLVNLPIGETSPVVRLHQVSYALKAHRETGRAVAANRLAGIAGFAPTTFHALGARVAAQQVRRGFNLVVTNVPGPQFPLYADGAQMLESYPVQPLLPGHALAIGVTSYDGAVSFGLNADFDAVPDLDVLAQCVEDALDELVDVSSTRQRAPRGRRAPQRGPRPGPGK